jgi:hypothetical protein
MKKVLLVPLLIVEKDSLYGEKLLMLNVTNVNLSFAQNVLINHIMEWHVINLKKIVKLMKVINYFRHIFNKNNAKNVLFVKH